MNIPNLYKKIKQILNDSNVILVNKGLNAVKNLSEIPSLIANIESINKLTYVLSGEIIEVTENDLDGISTIGDHVFSYCTNLKNITIPDSVTTIGEQTFYGCSSLASVTIGYSVTTIGDYAFSGCDSLTDIYLKPITPPILEDRYIIPDTTIIHVPVGSGNAYRNATNWSYYATRIIEDPEI